MPKAKQMKILLPASNRDLIANHTLVDEDLLVPFMRAKARNGMIVFSYTLDALDDLLGFIAAPRWSWTKEWTSVVQFLSTYGMERPEFRVFPIIGKRRWNNGF